MTPQGARGFHVVEAGGGWLPCTGAGGGSVCGVTWLYRCCLGAVHRVDVGLVVVTEEVKVGAAVHRGKDLLWFHVGFGCWFGVVGVSVMGPARVYVSSTGSVPLLGCAADRGCEGGMPGVGEPDVMGACDCSPELVPRG